jgi:hypothetical protein
LDLTNVLATVNIRVNSQGSKAYKGVNKIMRKYHHMLYNTYIYIYKTVVHKVPRLI